MIFSQCLDRHSWYFCPFFYAIKCAIAAGEDGSTEDDTFEDVEETTTEVATSNATKVEEVDERKELTTETEAPTTSAAETPTEEITTNSPTRINEAVPPDNQRPALKTYEQTFMRQVEELGGRRVRKPRDRLVENAYSVQDECNVVERLLAKPSEPKLGP